MTNIVLITSGSRPRLLEQTLRTLQANTPADQFSLTVVVDGPHPVGRTPPNTSHLVLDPPCKIIGRLKNLGAYWSEKHFGRGEWIMFCDDDLSFQAGWLTTMQAAFAYDSRIAIVGGCRHPFHGVNKAIAFHEDAPCFEITDAVAGYSHLMRWETWKQFGDYDAHAEGIGQSEDYSLCRRAVDKGRLVGYVTPACLHHCGLTASNGKPAIGSEAIVKVAGVYYE